MVGAGTQVERYRDFYERRTWLRWLLRFDVRYRCRRLPEVLAALGIRQQGARVLDVGFGGGHLLRSFPESCHIVGADISESAVRAARRSDAYDAWPSAYFKVVSEGDPQDLPGGSFDVIVSSHTLEHVPDDLATLTAIRRRLAPWGVLCVFVPLEEPNYNPDHVREYTLESIGRRIEAAGMDVLYVEGSMCLNGHVWKVLTIPSRRRWPVLGPLVDALRGALLSLVPYELHVALDRILPRSGCEPRQALVVARAR
jgi:SAM-dependent methyltransferase